MAMVNGNYHHHDYTIAWISALPLEMAAAAAMLDERHPDLTIDPSDNNSYIFGSIHGHNIVIACLPAGVYGTVSAATIASQVLFTFRSIRFGLMVGIGGGVPSQADIRLGDVVVSKPTRDYGGIVQYDYGKSLSGNRFERIGMLNKPPSVLLTAISRLQAEHMVRPSNIPAILSDMICRYPKMKDKFTYRGAEHDLLFESEYDHGDSNSTCADCDTKRRRIRPSRSDDTPMVHYGLIASANQVMKNARTRDQLAEEIGVLCFEMEAAGLMDTFPCLVIRGICDYVDSHKCKQWQEYAAATAAAYTKELLSVIHLKQVGDIPPSNITSELSQYGLKVRTCTESFAGEIRKRNQQVDIGQLLDRISDYDHDKVHRRLAQKRLSGTIEWFLNHALFRSWLTGDDHSSLWCSGKIGSGKTIIAATAVEAIKYRAHDDTRCHCPTVVFYCESENYGSLQASYILSSYIRQLTHLLHESSHVFPPNVARELERFFGGDRTVPDYEDLKDIFSHLFSYMPNTVYVLDGLDALEQSECQKILLLIQATFSTVRPPNGSKIFMLSRDQLPGYVNISTFMPWALRISTFENVTQDIEFYINVSIDDKSMLRKLTSNRALLNEIKHILITEASGMFLWPYLILEILWSTCFTDSELRSALSQLPRDLEETYRLCIRRVASDPRALKVLKWVGFAIRPLHIEELKEAVAFDTNDTLWDHEKVPQDEFVLGSCANLVVLDPTDHCVRFAHSSVKPFLLDQGHHDLNYPTSEAVGRLECGEFCVAYLSFSNFSLQVKSQEQDRSSTGSPFVMPALLAGEAFKSSLASLFRAHKSQKVSVKLPIRPIRTESPGGQYRFLNYAVSNWALQTSNITPRSPVWDRFTHLATSFNETWNFHPWVAGGRSRHSFLHGLFGWAVKAQHIPLLSIVMRYKQELARICNLPLVGEDLPALHLASKFGFLSIVQRLLNVCEINLPDLEGYTALHHAAEKGHLAIVETLLKVKGIDVNSKSRTQATPLWLAARSGHSSILQVLYKRGADYRVRNQAGRTPISIAADYQHDEVVKQIFEWRSTRLYVENSLSEIILRGDLKFLTDSHAIQMFHSEFESEVTLLRETELAVQPQQPVKHGRLPNGEISPSYSLFAEDLATVDRLMLSLLAFKWVVAGDYSSLSVHQLESVRLTRESFQLLQSWVLGVLTSSGQAMIQMLLIVIDHLREELDTPQAVQLRDHKLWKTDLEEKACSGLLKRFSKYESEVRKVLGLRKAINLVELMRGQGTLDSLQQVATNRHKYFELGYLSYLLYVAGAAGYTHSFGWPMLTDSICDLFVASRSIFVDIMSGTLPLEGGKQLHEIRNKLVAAGRDRGLNELLLDRSYIVQETSERGV